MRDINAGGLWIADAESGRDGMETINPKRTS
jgi:hypothetical protein